MKSQNGEHYVALDRQNVEKAAVELAPISVDHRPLLGRLDRAPHRVHIVGIGDKDFDDAGFAVLVEERLRLGERHEDEGVVESRHADLENGRDSVGLHARRDAERGLSAVRRDDCHLVADPQAQVLRELGADRDAPPRIETVERALNYVAGDARQAGEILPANAPDQRAGRAVGGARERLALDQRQRQGDARNLAHPLRHRVVVGQRRLDPLQEHVAIEADHFVHQVVAEAVHHRHDDDQRRDAEHDAEERKTCDDRDRALGVAGAQIAKSDHPLEGREGPCRRRRLRNSRLERNRSQRESPVIASDPRIKSGGKQSRSTSSALRSPGLLRRSRSSQ